MTERTITIVIDRVVLDADADLQDLQGAHGSARLAAELRESLTSHILARGLPPHFTRDARVLEASVGESGAMDGRTLGAALAGAQPRSGRRP